jgi:carboxypeptidase PM20D1
METLSKKDGMVYAEGLSKLIQVPTVSNSGDENFAKLRKTMAEVFPLVTKNLEQVLVYENALLYKWKGKSDKKPIVYMGHQDVVPANETTWKYPAFAGTIAEDKIWGRGTMDCKGTLYSEMQAIEELLEEGYVPENDVYIASSDGEEVFGPGAVKTKEYLRDHGVKPYIVLDEGGAIAEEIFKGINKPYCVIGVYEKGYADVKFIAKSKGGHSSTPPKNSPIARLSKFVADIESHDYFTKYMDNVVEEMLTALAPSLTGSLKFLLSRIKLFKPLIVKALPKQNGYGNALLSTTMAFTMSKAADAPNVLPQEASITANLRFSRHQDSAACYKILGELAKKYDLEMEILNSRDASPAVDTKGEGYNFLANCAKEHFTEYGVAPYVIMGGTDCRQYQDICDNAMRFTPILLSNQQLAAMHASNENVGIKAIADAVSFYKYVITKNI